MINKIKTIIKAKYYVYVPGEFHPFYIDGELANRREFHKYKLRRAIWRLQNPKLTYYQLTHHAG